MKSADTVRRAFQLRDEGFSQAAVARELGVSRAAVRDWWRAGLDASIARRTKVDRCPEECPLRDDPPGAPYAYLLGQYLGDGWINTRMPRGVCKLAITCCAYYPDIADECQRAMEAILPTNRVGRQARRGVTMVHCHSKHWPCLFPQCGPGPKHARPIVLEPWQEKIALVEHPKEFLRGLIHSDGWRGINPVRSAKGKRYEYIRYQFTNHSKDIRELFARACEAVGVEWKQMNRYNLSVNKRSDVAFLDTFIGPKS